MKPQWDKLLEAINAHADMLQEFVDNVTDSKTVKNLKLLTGGFNKVLTGASEVDRLVDPQQKLTIKMPFDNEEFHQLWQYYKEYLVEDFGMYLNSRREQIILNSLKKWSKDDADRAMEIVTFYMHNGYRRVFEPTTKQLSGEELPPEENSNRSINLNIDKSIR
ncbi:hypothetical protein M2132_001784 [Dysgonomonas sp. PH5-45]|uniref:hypothetical protein n=1 Tax=unclassified Dysgonomonas TaxID=2630389 RepID=UPI00247679A2|nr:MULTISPECIES: hypothetical protein [unclassified Dysgonomonas]MDH6355441.1 hypothetical protein [Dysgonomonas sp. PH5-45]MDH6388338.1 hypothetical protein [Dysgonomonas sp. PH5-37]